MQEAAAVPVAVCNLVGQPMRSCFPTAAAVEALSVALAVSGHQAVAVPLTALIMVALAVPESLAVAAVVAVPHRITALLVARVILLVVVLLGQEAHQAVVAVAALVY